MTRSRVVVFGVLLVLFLAGAGALVAANRGGGGQPVTIDLRVTGSAMTPDTPAARQGDRVTMTIAADRAEEIHLHGYDIPFEVPTAGGRVTHIFTADKSGSFELELEASSTHLGQFVVSP